MSFIKAWSPYLAMIAVTLAYGGSNILCKLALENGLSFLVFIVYRHLIALAILGPLAYVVEKKRRTSITLPILGKIFVLALLGTTIHQNVYYAGLNYTSPTVASALSNVIPSLTFILAVSLRIESVGIKNAKQKAKLLGALTCIAGAVIFTFWKGYLFKGLVSRPFIIVDERGSGHGYKHIKDDSLRGSLLILASYIAFSGWLIFQVFVYEVYPARLSMNAWICFFASLQSSVLALMFERNAASWKLDWNIQLFTIIYCGSIISCLAYYLQTFCISKRGPVFAAMFQPLLLVVVGIFSAVFLAERIHLGSLIGASIIILGLYLVLWGKSKDSSSNNDKSEAKIISSKAMQQVSTGTKDCEPV